jgi:hypothetical protein
MILKYKKTIFILFLTFFGKITLADQCTAVFPDGAQCNATNCQIKFNQCANQIFNNPSTQLPAITVTNHTGCSTFSCSTANCTATGTIGNTLGYGTFQTSTGANVTVPNNMTVTIDGNNNTTTNYGSVTVGNSGTLNFSPNPNGTTVYKMSSLTTNNNATINLQPGDYWIGSLSLGMSGIITVQGTGTARLHINNAINLTNTQQWNTSGSASALLVYSYNNITLNSSSTIHAILYAQGSATIKSSTVVTGAIAAQSVTFDNTATLTYDANAVNNMNFGSICPKTAYQFAVSAPATGTNCQNMTITVTAQNASGQTITNYTGAITLTTQNGSGTWVSTTGGGTFSGGSSGVATYQFVTSDSGVVNFQLNYPASGASPVIIKAYQTNNTSISGLSQAINFIPTGLLVTATAVSNPPAPPPNAFSTPQTSGNNFTVYLTAYNPSNCGIITSYSGAKTLRFWTSYVNPTTGTLNATINGTTIASSGGATPTTQSITFTNGAAAVTGKYTDVGQLMLSVQDTSSGGPSGISGNFVVIPASFAINIPGNNANQTLAPPANAQTACLADSVFVKAGNNFTVNVQPQNSLGAVTPNYGNESPTTQGILLQSSTLVAPTGTGTRNGSANNGAIGNNSAFTKVTNSAGPFTSPPYFTGSTFWFDEVGCINLTASVANGNYLGVPTNASGSMVVGRFIPDHFNASGNTPILTTGCSTALGSFTYLDQPFSYGTPPILTITASALAGTTTQNYTGSFWKLANTALSNTYNKQYYPVNGTDIIPNLTFFAVTPTPTFSDGGTVSTPGSSTFTFSAGNGLKIQRTNGTLVSPFTAEIQFSVTSIIDSDGVSCTNGCVTPSTFNFGATTAGSGISFSGVGGGKQFYHGRMLLVDTVGSGQLALTMPMQTQYYTPGGNGFALNTLDSCTTLSGGVSNLILTPSTGLSTTPSLSTNTFQQGNININLTAPNMTGYVDIETNLTATNNGASLLWLQYNWPYGGSTNGAFTADPHGHATFGIFKGNDRMIYMKEIFN